MGQAWDPEIDVSEGLARELISSQFPDLHPIDVERFGHGWDNAAFLVNGAHIFRFPRRMIAAPLIAIEARVLPLIAPQLPLAIPLPRFVGHPQGRYPWPFVGYEKLVGRTLCSARLDADCAALLAPGLGDFLRALHAIDAPAAVDGGLLPDQIGRLDHAKRWPLVLQRFSELQDADFIEDANLFLDYMARVRPDGKTERRNIVHGDLYARHLLVDGAGQLAGVIDWGDIHLGDPAVDLMVAHLVLPLSAHGAFLTRYGPVDERTWELARYRAIYHAVLVIDYGQKTADDNLRDAGLVALGYIGEAI